jgi:hypothetical protein
VLRSNPCDAPEATPGRAAPEPAILSDRRFVLYVEGPSDCDILRTWARLVSRPLSAQLTRCAVILGGRRPARAVEHFRSLRTDAAARAAVRGLCVLDRDGHAGSAQDGIPEGLELFTWPRRHIESYLLVPSAIRRCMRMDVGDPRLHDLLDDLPLGVCADALRDVDAKRLLVGKATLAKELGSALSPARIARCMNRSELHEDVLDLLARVQVAAGVRPECPGRGRR